MFTATAALIGGAEVTAGLALAAVAEVGMAVTVVGAVTDNKDMMKVGGVMSLAGGIGGMALGGWEQAAAWGASTSDTIAGAVSAAGGGPGMYGGAETLGAAVTTGGEWASAGGAMSGMDMAADIGVQASGLGAGFGSAAESASAAARAASAGLDTGGIIGNAVGQANQATQAAQAASQAGSVANTVSDPASVSNVANSASSPADVNILDDASIGSPQDLGREAVSRGAESASKPAASGLGGQQSSGGFWSGMQRVGEWADKHKTLAGMMVNVGSNMVLGAMQNDAQEEQLRLQRRKLALEEQALANRSAAPGVGMPSRPQPIINGVR